MQVGEVGDVGAEVVAAGAAEPERAGLATGLDVGRFGADPERDGATPGDGLILVRWPLAFKMSARSVNTSEVLVLVNHPNPDAGDIIL